MGLPWRLAEGMSMTVTVTVMVMAMAVMSTASPHGTEGSSFPDRCDDARFENAYQCGDDYPLCLDVFIPIECSGAQDDSCGSVGSDLFCCRNSVVSTGYACAYSRKSRW
ncbi:uncharacterized protein LOC143028229 [Oratosquilla oratoria]|uniref:uncharacterized protein LOC143028229 n=1 Tax=Oratosquilla oratoria TaxID=337810 RepID=UPI003F77323F